jgi:hypothetical protein
MRRQIFSLVTTLSFVVGLTAICFGQIPGAIQVDIPFDFNVGSKQLPGKYTIHRLSGQGTMIIQSAAAGSSAAFMVNGGDRVIGEAPTQVSFNRYGDQYFLSQIWDGSDNTGKKLGKSKAERETAARRRDHLAHDEANPQVVTQFGQSIK